MNCIVIWVGGAQGRSDHPHSKKKTALEPCGFRPVPPPVFFPKALPHFKTPKGVFLAASPHHVQYYASVNLTQASMLSVTCRAPPVV